MKKLLLLTILLLNHRPTHGFEVQPKCLDVTGKYSITNMHCQGKWENAYLVLDKEIFTGIFSGYETLELIQKDCNSLNMILSSQSKGAQRIIELPKFQKNKKVKMTFSDERIRMHQGYMFKHFVASFEKSEEDLVLTNEYGPGFKILEIMKECQLPRIHE